MRKLIEHSADVNAVDADNNTALAFSIRHGIHKKLREIIFLDKRELFSKRNFPN